MQRCLQSICVDDEILDETLKNALDYAAATWWPISIILTNWVKLCLQKYIRFWTETFLGKLKFSLQYTNIVMYEFKSKRISVGPIGKYDYMILFIKIYIMFWRIVKLRTLICLNYKNN